MLIFQHILHECLRYIKDYATSHTHDSVYIIGGRSWNPASTNIPIIAQFQDNKWSIAGYLRRPRCGHGAITVNGMTLIIGGIRSLDTEPGFHTELLEYESFETEEIEPILISYIDIGLFLVEEGFCSKNKRK